MNEDNVLSIRRRVWDAGFRPVPVVSYDMPGPSPGKRPLGQDWIGAARMDPPFCVTSPPVSHAMNTGILADGLRAVDIDVDDPALVARIQAEAERILGGAPRRTRANSPRILMLYLAWEGEPGKRSIAGDHGKVEILGRGQQFVAYGMHASGVPLEWPEEGPGDFTETELIPVREIQIDEFLAAVAPIVGAPEDVRITSGQGILSGENPLTSGLGQRTSILSAADALAQIRNEGPRDWEKWNRVGMALWAATGGTEGGREVWHAWSGQHPAYDPDETNARWDHYFNSPPTQIGAGTLFHLAAEASPGWKPAHHHEPVAAEEAEPGADDLYLDMETLGEIKPIQWVVRHMLERDALGLIFGGPGAGKSFAAMDISCCVATGLPWRGKFPVQAGRVIYIAGEGHAGLHRRYVAWKLANQVAHIPQGRLYKSASAMRTLDEKSVKAHSDRIAAICADEPPVLVVIDTLARNYGPGDENSTKDMTLFIDALDFWFRQRFGCCVLLVHHSGHNMDRARGSSSLKAAIDAEYEVTKTEEGVITFQPRKMKDAEEPDPLAFRLESVDLGVVDDLGEPITSAVLVDDQVPQTSVLDEILAKDTKGRPVTVRWALARLDDGWMTHDEMENAAGVSARGAKQIFDRLETMGLIQKGSGKGAGTQPGRVTDLGSDALSQNVGHALAQKLRKGRESD